MLATPFTIPDTFYTGSKTSAAADADVIASNVKRRKNMVGVAGTLGLPKSGHTTAYGTGSDGDVEAGSALSVTAIQEALSAPAGRDCESNSRTISGRGDPPQPQERDARERQGEHQDAHVSHDRGSCRVAFAVDAEASTGTHIVGAALLADGATCLAKLAAADEIVTVTGALVTARFAEVATGLAR